MNGTTTFSEGVPIEEYNESSSSIDHPAASTPSHHADKN